MYSTSTAATQLATMFTDSGTLIAIVVAAVVVGLVALLGLGFGIRHLKKYITGRKF